MPVLFYIGSSVMSDSGNTSELKNMNVPPQVKEMIVNNMKNSVRDSMNLNIKRYLVTGAMYLVLLVDFVGNILVVKVLIILKKDISLFY